MTGSDTDTTDNTQSDRPSWGPPRGDLKSVLPPAGWLDDPTEAFKYRYWDGCRWTEHVSDGGEAKTDDRISGKSGGWFEDPTKAFKYRYWNGRNWTEHVSDGGATKTDGYQDSYRYDITTNSMTRRDGDNTYAARIVVWLILCVLLSLGVALIATIPVAGLPIAAVIVLVFRLRRWGVF